MALVCSGPASHSAQAGRNRDADRPPRQPGQAAERPIPLLTRRKLRTRVVGLLGLVPGGPVGPLLLAVDDHPDLGECGHHLGSGSELLAVVRRTVEGEIVERVEDLQHGADVELGVPLVQVEEELEHLVGRVDAEPHQGHEQAVAGAVVVGPAGPRRVEPGLPGAACGRGPVAVVLLGPLELGSSHARETGERGRVAAQRGVAQHRAVPPADTLRPNWPDGNCATTLLACTFRNLPP